MRLDVRLPIRFRAVTKRSPRERNVYCSKRLSVDVPELSRNEAEVAFRMRTRNGDHELLTVDGRLFRPLVFANKTTEAVLAQLGEAFSVLPVGPTSVEHATEITRPDLDNQSPFRFPIEVQFHRANLLRHRHDQVDWPEGGTVLVDDDNNEYLEEAAWLNTRNSFDFDAMLGKLANTNEDDLALASRMHDLQLSKLVLIDGQPWYETRPPCVKARASGNHYHVGFFPDFIDQRIDWQYIGFDELDALPFAVKSGVLPDGEAFDCIQPVLMAFDGLGLAARRMTSALSTWTVHCLNDVRRSSIRDRLEIDAVAEEAIRWNELLGEGGDLESNLDTAVAAWQKTETPVDHLDWGYMHGESPTSMVELVCERYSDRPISLGIDVPWASRKP
jgi:hypothetical protein